LNTYTLFAWSVALPAACVAFTIVVTPLASVLVVVTDVSVPEPVRVVPDGRFEQVAEDSVKLTWDVATVAPPLAVAAQERQSSAGSNGPVLCIDHPEFLLV
jgi:hypothetical protein